MAKTRLQTLTLVRSFLDESSANAADWTDSELNILINTKYHELRSFVISTFKDYYDTTAQFDSKASQEEYTSADGLPTNIYKLRRVELNYDVTAASGAPTRCLPIKNIDAVRRDLGYANAGIGLKVYGNAMYYELGYGSNMTLGFIPKPDKAGTNAIKLWYVKEEVDLAADSTTLDIPYADKNYIIVVYGAVSDALRFGSQDIEGADKFEAKQKVAQDKMQEELEEKNIEEPVQIIDVSGDNLNFDAPY